MARDPSGLTESPAPLLSNGESGDRWPPQSGSMLVEHMQGTAGDVMSAATDAEMPKCGLVVLIVCHPFKG